MSADKYGKVLALYFEPKEVKLVQAAAANAGMDVEDYAKQCVLVLVGVFADWSKAAKKKGKAKR